MDESDLDEVWVEAPTGEGSQPLDETSDSLSGTSLPSYSSRMFRAEIDTHRVAVSETPVDYRLSELRRGSGPVELVEAGARGENGIARPTKYGWF